MNTRFLSARTLIISVNITLLWFIVLMMMLDGEQATNDIRLDAIDMRTLQVANDKGGRFTVCDFIKYQVHLGADKSLLNECIDAPMTDIDSLLYSGSLSY